MKIRNEPPTLDGHILQLIAVFIVLIILAWTADAKEYELVIVENLGTCSAYGAAQAAIAFEEGGMDSMQDTLSVLASRGECENYSGPAVITEAIDQRSHGIDIITVFVAYIKDGELVYVFTKEVAI